ncbi:DUF4157 domain-containing protein [Dyella tabacisoli]|uniref:eCIS core domain-containing protein n=1 Tax=Dyella tabacisoli TaxID=2282381 RepID=UPI001CDBE60F|nr:DUF4157 domain-containing protein [Dyella tabacisoli]
MGPQVAQQGGVPLPATTRAFFEPRFDFDFSKVRIHADAEAEAAANLVGAQAYTVGQHIRFATGAYSPASPSGQHLLAHELAHVVQYHHAGAPRQLVSAPDEPAELEADAQARRITREGMAGGPFIPHARPSALIARQPAPAAAKRFAPDQRVIATTAFALMDQLGGEKNQKKIKQIAKGDLLKVVGEPPNGGGLAFTVTVMKSDTEEELDGKGQRQVGVASVSWLGPAPAPKPAPPPAKDASPPMDLPKAATEMEFSLGTDDATGATTLTYTPVVKRNNYVDNSTRILGFSALQVAFGGYTIFINGFDKPILIPTDYVDRAATTATPISDHVYPDRESALAAVAAAGGGDRIAYYQAVQGLIVPTAFSRATTPQILAMINNNWKVITDEMNLVLTLYAVSLAGTILGNVTIQLTAGDRSTLQAKQIKQQGNTDADVTNKPPAPRTGTTTEGATTTTNEGAATTTNEGAATATNEGTATATNEGAPAKPTTKQPVVDATAPKPTGNPALKVLPPVMESGSQRWHAVDIANGNVVGEAYVDANGRLRMSINTGNQGEHKIPITGQQIHEALLNASNGAKLPFQAEWRPALPNNLETFNGQLLAGKTEAEAAGATWTGQRCSERGLKPSVIGGEKNAPGTTVSVRDATGKPMTAQVDAKGVTYKTADVLFEPAAK